MHRHLPEKIIQKYKRLVCNGLLCILIEYVDLFRIKGKLDIVARSCGGTGINPCSDGSFFKIEIQGFLELFIRFILKKKKREDWIKREFYGKPQWKLLDSL